jgi:signal transduction histidine kinase
MPVVFFLLCKITGFSLLFAHWLYSGELTDFFLLLFLIIMSLLRWRFPKITPAIILDSVILAVTGWWLVFFIFTVAEIFYLLIKKERKRLHKQRDETAERYYDLESLQSDLTAALSQVERMTAVAERTRIARDIHDNSGHEIVAAYMSLQTARSLFNGQLTSDNGQLNEALELYDSALERLSNGVNKIREAVHNLSAVTFLGVDSLREICRKFPVCDVEFKVYGDTTAVPIYVWSMLESCLNESLTNTARHSSAKKATVNLDVTQHIVRLCIENDGVSEKSDKLGVGLRNLRQRAAAIGGSLSVDSGEVFRVVCVIPMKEII